MLAKLKFFRKYQSSSSGVYWDKALGGGNAKMTKDATTQGLAEVGIKFMIDNMKMG